jgi:fibrillarin-like rRNA methylase
MLKARSVNVAERPDDVFRRIIDVLNNTAGIRILEKHRLEPFHKDHLALVVSYKAQ